MFEISIINFFVKAKHRLNNCMRLVFHQVSLTGPIWMKSPILRWENFSDDNFAEIYFSLLFWILVEIFYLYCFCNNKNCFQYISRFSFLIRIKWLFKIFGMWSLWFIHFWSIIFLCGKWENLFPTSLVCFESKMGNEKTLFSFPFYTPFYATIFPLPGVTVNFVVM